MKIFLLPTFMNVKKSYIFTSSSVACRLRCSCSCALLSFVQWWKCVFISSYENKNAFTHFVIYLLWYLCGRRSDAYGISSWMMSRILLCFALLSLLLQISLFCLFAKHNPSADVLKRRDMSLCDNKSSMRGDGRESWWKNLFLSRIMTIKLLLESSVYVNARKRRCSTRERDKGSKLK